MTTLLWPALRARLTIALVTLVLSAFAAAAAAAGPLYGSVAMQSSRAAEVLAAPVDQRTIVATRAAETTGGEEDVTLPYLPGFQTIYGWIVPGQAYTATQAWPGSRLPLLVSRKGACEHLSVASGRCPVADREIMVREDSARLLDLKPGGDLTYKAGEAGPFSLPQRVTVVGVYGFLDAADPFWSIREELIIAPGGPIITTDRTAGIVAPLGSQTADMIATPAAFADLPKLKADLETVQERLMAGRFGTNTEVPALIERIEESDGLLRNSLLMAIVPLVLLSWLVLFLAVTGAVEQRRSELGLAALRGVPAGWRWLLPTLETAIPVLAGTIPGYFLGYVAVQAIAGTPAPGWEAVAYVAIATGGALVAGGAAQIQALTSPVLSLLRRSRVNGSSAGRQIAEIGALVLAVAAGVQAAFASRGQGGVGLLAPVCVALGLGLAGARLLTGPASRTGRWALRRGLVRTGLIALSLARRPGTPAIVALLTVVFGMFGFALAASDISERAREERARIELGADRVILVDRTSVPSLLDAVRKVDPQGEFAMAAVEFPGSMEAPILAVDSTRFAGVAVWPETSALTAAEAGKALRPSAVDKFQLRGGELVFTVDTKLSPESVVVINLRVMSEGVLTSLRTEELIAGKQAYRVPTDACKKDCQLDEVEVRFLSRHAPLEVTFGDITDETGAVVVSAAQMGERSRWLKPQNAKFSVSGGEAGLTIAMSGQSNEDARIYPAAVPAQLPMVAAGSAPQELTGHSGTVFYPVTQVANLPQVPRYGSAGAIMDIEYMDLGPAGGGEISRPEVWLNDKAPADVLDKLRAAGLTILEDRTVTLRQQELRDQAPAQATRFLVFATFGALIIAAGALLVAAVLERDRPEDGLSALRPQGVSAHALGSVAAGVRWVGLLVSAVLGLIGAAVSWWIARHVVPVFTDGSRLVRIPDLPAWQSVLLPVTAAAAVLVLICWVAARVARFEGSSR